MEYESLICGKIITMSKEIIFSKEAPAPIGPYSQAVKAGNTLYVSGQIALDADTGELINDNITEETHAVMKNLEAVLRQAGYGFGDVVKCTIFIKDMGQFATINEAYGQYFKSNPPARETVEVSRLPKDVNVEISCIAVK
jgi:2-iminobutanoate/2-iminopropanoate deaminase